VYLAGGGLYQVDAKHGRLVRLLAPGDSVQDGIVGELDAAATDGPGLIATDGMAAYERDGAGRWTRRPLGLDDGETPWPPMPVAAFQGSLYALATETGRVLKFPAENLAAPPLTWVGAGDYPELTDARDLVIDGRVHVLLADGRVLTFYRGGLQATLTPDLDPPLAEPVALAGGPDTNFLYLVDAGAEIGMTTGRLVRLDGSGGTLQFLPPIPTTEGDAAAHALANVRDLVVDEAAGIVYFVTDRDLWRATLPPTYPAAAT